MMPAVVVFIVANEHPDISKLLYLSIYTVYAPIIKID